MTETGYGDEDDPVRAALAAHVGEDEAKALLTRLNDYSNTPNAIKGAARRPADPDVERAALALVEDDDLAIALGLQQSPELEGWPRSPTQELWGLLTLAARVDPGVVDRLEPHLGGEHHARTVAAVRRAARR